MRGLLRANRVKVRTIVTKSHELHNVTCGDKVNGLGWQMEDNLDKTTHLETMLEVSCHTLALTHTEVSYLRSSEHVEVTAYLLEVEAI